MNFFEEQEKARRSTSRLVLLFLLGLLGIIVAVYGSVVLLLVANDEQQYVPLEHQLWNPELFAIVSGITLVVVLAGSLFKFLQLSGGGAAVATALGGRLLDPTTQDADERRLLNIVEEMAIASGCRVPPVYLLDQEQGINAFAAGFSLKDAVLGVTSGAVKTLKRDELQGVMGHEFSHILNGDMRMNLRLMAAIHGILVIGILGRELLQAMGRSRGGRGKDSGGKGAIMLFGLALTVIGYIGVFFGSLIKSAVSRQREFLADASAVQFTRNPQGIADALQRIAAVSSQLATARAEEASHMFFANGLRSSFLSLMATHPPLPERIRRILGRAVELPEQEVAATAADPTSGLVSGFAAQELQHSVGNPRPENLQRAAGFVSGLPEALHLALRDTFGAQAIVFGTAMSADEDAFATQLQFLAGASDPLVLSELKKLAPVVQQVPAGERLALVDLALPMLAALSRPQYERFRDALKNFVGLDKYISLSEYALLRIVLSTLDLRQGLRKRESERYTKMESIVEDCVQLLSTLAFAGQQFAEDKVEEATLAFQRGAAVLGVGTKLQLLEFQNCCTLEGVDQALETLESSSPLLKEKMLQAAMQCVTADGFVCQEEAELLRILAAAMECPVPMLKHSP